MIDNKMPSAQAGSFLWLCNDDAGSPCELAVRFEPLDGNPRELILVVSAYRKIK